MANQLYIATANAPLSDRFQEMLDMLMTGAAFGVSTTLLLTDGCLSALVALPTNDSLLQLPDFGVRCVASETAEHGDIALETLNAGALEKLRGDSQQIVVF